MSDEGSKVDVNRVVSAYLKLRDKRAALKRKFDLLDGDLKDKMAKCELFLLTTMDTTGTSQLGTPEGTAYKEISMRASCSDWPSYWDFIASNKRFDMLEKRPATKAIQTYFDETGDLPPGININQEYKVIIRRK